MSTIQCRLSEEVGEDEAIEIVGVVVDVDVVEEKVMPEVNEEEEEEEER